MPKATGLQFFRKRQSLANLEFERPQSLSSVYEAVKQAALGIEERLSMLEMSFYGPGKHIEEEVKKWLPQIEAVIKPARYTELSCRRQVVDITERVHNAADKLMVDMHCLSAVHECVRKILTTLRLGFSDMILVIQKLLSYTNKYMLSFSAPLGDSYLETATNYEKQRQELSQAIQVNVDNITEMADKFERDELHINHFDYWVKTVAERCDCMHASILMAFPAACENIRNVCADIRKWLEADSSYSTYLMFDIEALESQRETQTRKVRDLQVKVCNTEYKVKVIKKDITDCDEELVRVSSKEKELQQEESYLMVAHHDVLFDLEIKDFRIEDMKRQSTKNNSREFNEAYERLLSEINALKDKKPAIDRKLGDINKKMAWIREKQEKARQRSSQLEDAKTDLRHAKKTARKAEVELERVETCLTKVKDIHRIKTSPETLKKIFHKLPFTPRKLNASKKTDKLERACRITAAWVEGDWVKLYRSLPFYPARGEETVGADIDNIFKTYMRHTVEEQAKQALCRWRRMHTRAKLEDLVDTLHEIRRRDIVDKIEEDFNARKKPHIQTPLVRTVHFPKLPVR
ncbi:uncharacterized protein LOC124127798 [Haliotis rufescens]|uniref:uncharacterized protein LOC124127798 n=1 Tax=Haliotis rufescens TaxID=6454 RepID=UPI00201E8733|nr:uncharacterized protein LOC124127798 [Haliotis rufescens]XP_046347126.2 uncharacterized protein LOC124127798 [Haliotis rufescens]